MVEYEFTLKLYVLEVGSVLRITGHAVPVYLKYNEEKEELTLILLEVREGNKP